MSDGLPPFNPDCPGYCFGCIEKCPIKLVGFGKIELTSPARYASLAHARQILMYVLWQNTRMTLAEIGEYLGGRTPATVSWGYQRIAERLPRDKKLQKIVKRIGEKLETGITQ